MIRAMFFSRQKAQAEGAERRRSVSGSGLRPKALTDEGASVAQGFALCSAPSALRLKKALSFLLALPVHLYRLTLSPFLGRACRHVPTCSLYMLDALKMHGPFAGFAMGLGRILRCNPWGTHGYDPVPLFRFRKYKPLKTYFGIWKCENRLKK